MKIKKQKQIREENKTTQRTMAIIIGTTEPTYNRKEKGARNFTLEEGLKISNYFNKTVNEIFQTERRTLNLFKRGIIMVGGYAFIETY